MSPSVDRVNNNGWLESLPNIGWWYLYIKNNGINIATKFRANDFWKTGRSPASLKNTDIKLKPIAEIKMAMIPFTLGFNFIASFI